MTKWQLILKSSLKAQLEKELQQLSMEEDRIFSPKIFLKFKASLTPSLQCYLLKILQLFVIVKELIYQMSNNQPWNFNLRLRKDRDYKMKCLKYQDNFKLLKTSWTRKPRLTVVRLRKHNKMKIKSRKMILHRGSILTRNRSFKENRQEFLLPMFKSKERYV